VITKFNIFSSNKLNEIAGIYDGYYGTSLNDFRMSDLYQITALSAQSTIEIFNGNDTFQDALMPTSSVWKMVDVGYKSCTSGMMGLLKENFKKSDIEAFEDLLYMKENKEIVKKVAKVLKSDIQNFKSYLETILPDQVTNLKKIKIERSDSTFSDASSPIDVVQKEILIKTRKYRNPVYMVGVFLTNLIGNYQPAQSFLSMTDFVKKYDLAVFHSIFGSSNVINNLDEFETIVEKPLKKLAESLLQTYYHMRYYDLIPGADNAWKAVVIAHALEILIDNCILVEDDKISATLAIKFSKEIKNHAQTKTWIGYEGIQEAPIIKSVQKTLQAMGLFKGGITGKFGELTHTAVIKFQENAVNKEGKRIKVDGRIGNQTRWALENLSDSYIPYKKKEESGGEKKESKKKGEMVWPDVNKKEDGKPKKPVII
jgi:hypothetical protein